MLSLTIRRLGVCEHLTQPCYIKMCAEMRSVVKRIKKNQVIITALAIMIAVAGYINYAGNISDIISVSGRGEAAATDVAASEILLMFVSFSQYGRLSSSNPHHCKTVSKTKPLV